ncbi:MAG: twin-arginine translocase TatA/TatE family subunit [Actinomycetota bacterium]
MVATIFSPEILVILIVVVALLVGAKRIPQMARSLGSAKSEFEKGIKEGEVATTGDAKETPTETPKD